MSDINNERQNHPELIVRDLEQYVEAPVTRAILKRRGVNKWLRVRRLLIQLKDRWKDEINEKTKLYHEAKQRRDFRAMHRLAGELKALAHCRQQVRALCHSPRDVDFPDRVEWGDNCKLPEEFPEQPHKRWFWKHDGLKQ